MKPFDHRYASNYYRKIDPQSMPPEKWFEFLRKDEEYCKKWNLFKEIVYRLHRLRYKTGSLGSWHIEVARRVRDRDKQYIKLLEAKVEKCMKDFDLIKYEFSGSTSLDVVLKQIEKLKQETKRKSIFL